MLLAAFFADHPGPQRPWRTMAHMLRVAARQVRDPVFVLVLMKTDDRGWFPLFHPLRVVHAAMPCWVAYKA